MDFLRAYGAELFRELGEGMMVGEGSAEDQLAALEHSALHGREAAANVTVVPALLEVDPVHLPEDPQRVGECAAVGVLVAASVEEGAAAEAKVPRGIREEQIPLDAHEVPAVVRPDAVGVVDDEHLALAAEDNVEALGQPLGALILADDALVEELAPRVEDACHLVGVVAVTHRVDVKLKHRAHGREELLDERPQLGPHPHVREVVQEPPILAACGFALRPSVESPSGEERGGRFSGSDG
mmetsp:Transcript_17483/g.41821  ORF Transcript_17483/g.41821 Transcript_17483/m.41821 type:complete len:240 (+) Transcript_17483:333-1052(+)